MNPTNYELIYWFNLAMAISKTVSKQKHLEQAVIGSSTVRQTKN